MEIEIIIIIVAVIAFFLYDYAKTKSRCGDLADSNKVLSESYNQKNKEIKEFNTLINTTTAFGLQVCI